MAEGFEGMDDLDQALKDLPEKVQRRIARAWTRKWSLVAWAAAVQKTPVGKTRNLIAGVVRRDSKPRTLRNLQSFSRSVVIGRRPAFHFHLVNLGTKPRFTKGGTSRGAKGRFVVATSKEKKVNPRAFRGIMPKNDFVADAARPLMGQAEADLRTLVQRNIERLLRSKGK